MIMMIVMVGEVTFSMKAIDDFYNANRRLGMIVQEEVDVVFTCLSSSQVYFLDIIPWIPK